ncbi:MAG TPA: glycosyltransferase family A protein [Flavobacteriales bacterium]|nr:glycosyltransferase family A protein [Flavobacteriales bacterium]
MIIPCYNVKEHVGAAVKSALAQTHADLEIVVIDDGSTDGTAHVLEAIAREHGDRLSIVHQQNQGACAARNAGVAATTGDWIQFLDADDRIAPDKIERQLDLLRVDTDVVVGGYRNNFADGRAPVEVIPVESDPWEALIRTRMGTTSANLFRRTALVNAGGWDASLRSSQDYDLLFRMLKKGAAIQWDPHVRCGVLKRNEGSISRTDEPENWKRYLDLRCAIRDHLKTLDPIAHAATIAIADQYLFMAIRVLSKHDRSAAREAFQCMLPKGFIPEANAATTSTYVRVFNLLGFNWAERIASARSLNR